MIKASNLDHVKIALGFVSFFLFSLIAIGMSMASVPYKICVLDHLFVLLLSEIHSGSLKSSSKLPERFTLEVAGWNLSVVFDNSKQST